MRKKKEKINRVSRGVGLVSLAGLTALIGISGLDILIRYFGIAQSEAIEEDRQTNIRKLERTLTNEEYDAINEVGYVPVQGVESVVDSEARVADESVVETKPKQIEPETNYELSIRKNPSPDYTPGRKNKIDTIVLHTTGGSGTGAEDWLTRKDNVPASAHYLIMEDGELVRLVDDKNTAWHCRGYNDRSIGIEFAGYHDKPLNESQIRGGQQLIKFLMQKYGISRKNIRAHSELDPSRRKDPGKANMDAILSGIN